MLAENTSFIKRFVLFAIKTGISFALIVWLIRQKRLQFGWFSNLQFDIDTIALLLAGALCVLFGLLLLGGRLWLLIRSKKFLVPYRRVLGLTFVGSFFGVLLPGLMGGDVMKAVYLYSNVSERRADAISIVFIDRFLGIYSLLLLGALALFLAGVLDTIPFNLNILLFVPTIVIVVGFLMILIAWDGFTNTIIVKAFFAYLPQTFKKFLKALREYLKTPKLVILVIILSVFNHSLVICTFVIADIILKDNIPLSVHFIVDPLAMVMNVIPVTPGGLGVSESAFSFLFEAAGSNNGAMVGLFGRFIQYAVYMSTGGVAFLFLKMKSQILSKD